MSSNAECGVRSAECGVRSAECGVRSAECGVRSAECGRIGALLLAIIGVGMVWEAGLQRRAWAQTGTSPMTLVVLDFEINLAIANSDAKAYDQLPVMLANRHMRAQAAQSDLYTLVDGTVVTQAVADRGFPCTTDACAVALGKALGVQRILRGQVIKVSALIWYVSARLLDVDTATLLRDETVQFRGNVTEVMPPVIAIVWRRLHEPE